MSVKTFLLCFLAAIGIAQTGQFFTTWPLVASSPTTSAQSVFGEDATNDQCVAKRTGTGSIAAMGGDSTRLLFEKKLASLTDSARPEKLHLTLDRTLLAPGDDLWFTCWLRDANTLQPSPVSDVVHVELLDPRGSVVVKKTLLAPGGIAPGDLQIDRNLPGGQYKIRAFTNWMKNTGTTFERDLTVQKTVLPYLRLKLDFERKSFGPGEAVIARFDAASLDNKPISGKNLSFSAKIGGADFQTGTASTDENGRAYVRFELPKDLSTNDGLLNISIEKDGVSESISRAVPIVLGKIDLQFFPEGGDVVAGLPSRIAFKAVNEFGKPADVAGQVFDAKNRLVATFESFHDGMGAFDFTPRPGEVYSAKLSSPASCNSVFKLPTAVESGLSMRLLERKGSLLFFEINSSGPAGKFFFTGASRDKVLSFNQLELGGGSAKLAIETADWPMGVARFTLFDEKMRPVAERLAFANRDRQLKIELTTDKEKYLPRDRVKLKISARDGDGRPVKTQIALAVTDDKLLTFADDKQGNILAELMLQQDVRGKIEEPNFYFDPAEAKAEQALDLLLMTQGWRRLGWERAISGGPLAFQNRPERARIAGHLYDYEKKRAISEEKISLYPGGPTVKTNRLGSFDFGAIDINRYSHIQYGKYGFFPLDRYSDSLNLVFCKKGDPFDMRGVEMKTEELPGGAAIRGRVTVQNWQSANSKVKIYRDGDLLQTLTTDARGSYAADIDPGFYELQFITPGFRGKKVGEIEVLRGRATVVNKDFSYDETSYYRRESLTEKQKTGKPRPQAVSPAGALTAETIRELPTRNLNVVADINEKEEARQITAVDGGDVTIRGTRDNAANYYIDGIRVNDDLGKMALKADRSQAALGGLPAEFEADGSALMECVVVAYKVPLIQADNSTQGCSFTRELGAFRTIMSDPPSNDLLFDRDESVPNQPNRRLEYNYVRQFYSPNYGRRPAPAQRNDFRPTIFWSPQIETDERGEATVEFSTSDALTTFRATAEGIGGGLVGRTEKRFFAQKPLEISCKLPYQVQTGDLLRLPVLLKNNSAEAVAGQLKISAPSHFVIDDGQWTADGKTVEIAAGEAKTVEIGCQIGREIDVRDWLKISFTGSNGLSDALDGRVKTSVAGFPATQVFSGNSMQNLIEPRLVNPIEGTVSAKITAYPSVLEDLSASLERMLRQPSGCFEQVSSSNYPNLLVLDFLKKTGQLRPEIESKARALLEDGYKRLVAYESKTGGFDWYGRSPGHEGLTAYGILEFTDMARVFPVDKKMVERTADWLLSRRDGRGGWKRNQEGYDSFSGENAPNSYIVWCLAEAGYGSKIGDEIDATLKKAQANGDNYQLALLANALLKTGDVRAKSLISNFLQKQKEDGSWEATGKSALGGYGSGLKVETASLVALALMRAEKADEHALEKAIGFLMKSKTAYGYGSTQSTVLALRALIEYGARQTQMSEAGNLVVMIDGRRVAEQGWASGQLNTLKIIGLEKFFTNDRPHVEIFFEKTRKPIPFDFELKYSASRPSDAPGCPLAISTFLEKTQASIGETVRLTASVENRGMDDAASPMLVVGIPAGLSLQPWQLKKLAEEKVFDFYELWDGFAVFHFERLRGREKRAVALDLRAEIPGRFAAPASEAFLYYTNEMRVFARPEAVVLQ